MGKLQRLWNTITFAEKEKDKKKPPAGEVAEALGETVGDSFMDFGLDTNPNDFFDSSNSGTIVEQVREMDNTDSRLFGLMQTRKLSILSLKREIIGDGAEADFVRDVFSQIPNFHNTFYQILSAIPCGFSVTELVWGEREGRFVLEDLKPRYQGKFGFKDNELRLLTKDEPENGIQVHPDKFKVMTFMEEYGNRYGSALYHKVYWDWYFKRNSVQFWSIFTERFITPIVIATEEGGVGKENKKRIDAFIRNIRAATGVRVPKGVAISLLEASQNGVDSYEKFVNYLNKGQAIAILGQSSSVDDRKVGSYASDKVKENITRGDILGFDILMCETFVNDQIIKPLVEYNFPNVKECPKWRICKGRVEDLELMAKVVETLHKLGVKITTNYIYETFGIPIPDEGEEILEAPQLAPPAPKEEKFSEVMANVQKIRYIEDLKGIGEMRQ